MGAVTKPATSKKKSVKVVAAASKDLKVTFTVLTKAEVEKGRSTAYQYAI